MIKGEMDENGHDEQPHTDKIEQTNDIYQCHYELQ